MDFHDTLREVLAIKGWLGRRLAGERRPRVGPALVEDLAAWHATLPPPTGLVGPVTAILVEAHLAPPEGRVLQVVWAALEARHGMPREILSELVFGGGGPC